MSIQSRQGYALPLIVLVLLVGSIGAMAAASVAGQQARFPRLLDSSIRAIHAAESGAAFVVNSFARQDLAWPADGNYCDDGVGCDASLAALPGVPTASSPAAHGMDQWWVDSLQVNGTSMSIWIRGVDASGRATRQDPGRVPARRSPADIGLLHGRRRMQRRQSERLGQDRLL